MMSVSKEDDSRVTQLRRLRETVAATAEVRTRAAQAQARSAELVEQALAVVSQTTLRRRPGLRPATNVGRGAADAGSRPESWSAIITTPCVTHLRHSISEICRQAGLSDEPLGHFALAVQELMTNAIRHGGGWGLVRLHRDGNLLTCTVIDFGPGFAGDPATFGALPSGDSKGGRGLFLARRLTTSMLVDSRRARTVVTVTVEMPNGSPEVAVIP